MQRFGQIIQIKLEKIEEYKALHKQVPKTVLTRLKQSHIQNYSIYLFGQYLFAYFEYTGQDFEKDFEAISNDESTKQWWKLTDPCQISLGYAGQKWVGMQEVFHLD